MDPAPKQTVAEAGLIHDALQVTPRPGLDPSGGPAVVPVDAIQPVRSPTLRRGATATPSGHTQAPTDGGLGTPGPFGPAVEAAMTMA